MNQNKTRTKRIWEIFLLSVMTIFGIGSQYFSNMSYSLNQGLLQSVFDINSKYLIVPAVLANFSFAIGVPFGHVLSHKIGFRRTYLAFTSLFLVASFICLITTNMVGFSIGKMLQGLSTGILFFTVLPKAFMIFPARYKNVFLSMVIIGLFGANALGGMSGSFAMEINEWRWLFVLNIVAAIICIIIGLFTLKDLDDGKVDDHKIDWRETILLILFAVVAGFAFTILPILGLDSFTFWAMIVLALLIFIGFAIANQKSVQPIVHFHTLLEPKPIVGSVMAISSHMTLVAALAGINIFLLRILKLPPEDIVTFYLFFLLGVIVSGIVKMLTYSALGAGILGTIGSLSILVVSVNWRDISTDVVLDSLDLHAFLLGLGISMTLLSGAMATLLDGDLSRASHRSTSMHTIRNFAGAALIAFLAWYMSHDIEKQMEYLSALDFKSKEEAMLALQSMIVATTHDVFNIMIIFNLIMLVASIIQIFLGKGRRIVAKKPVVNSQ